MEVKTNSPQKRTIPIASSAPGSSDPVGDEWPMFRGQLNHTGMSQTEPAGNAGPFWSYATGGGMESPAVAGGRVYMGSDDSKVYCLDSATGSSIWNYTTGWYVESSPAVAGGLVYVGGGNWKIYCLGATTGALDWSFLTGGDIISSPAVAGGRVYVGSGDGLIYCLNATTGASIWNFTTGGGVGSPAVAGGLVYVGSGDGNVYCFGAATGALQYFWYYSTGGAVESSPAVAGGRVYVGSDDSKVYCLDSATGASIWNFTTGGAVSSSPAVAGGRVYVGSSDHNMYYLDANTGSTIWNYTTGSYVDSSPAVAAGRVYVGSNDGMVYCLDADTGALQWNYATGDAAGSPAVAGGRVYVRSYYGKVYCLPMLMPPVVPTLVSVAPHLSSNGNVTLQWTSSNGASIYDVYQYPTPITVINGSVTHAGSATSLTFNDSIATNGTYYYAVTASNAIGASGPSNSLWVVVGISPPNPANNIWSNWILYVSLGGVAIVVVAIIRAWTSRAVPKGGTVINNDDEIFSDLENSI